MIGPDGGGLQQGFSARKVLGKRDGSCFGKSLGVVLQSTKSDMLFYFIIECRITGASAAIPGKMQTVWFPDWHGLARFFFF